MKINKKRPPPHSRKRGTITVTLECPTALYKKLRQQAKKESRSISAWIRHNLMELLQQ